MLCAVALVGCGRSAGDATARRALASPGHSLRIAANAEGQPRYDVTGLAARPGPVALTFTNRSPLRHNLTVASQSGTVLGATATFKGGSQTLVLALKPGTYELFCTVPRHRQYGMHAALTVQ